MKRSSARISLATQRSAPTTIRTAAFLLTVAAAAALSPPAWASTVELPAGSVNGLAAAIAQAGSGGTVLLKSGLHKEAATVMVTAPITLAGEPGAILESATAIASPNAIPLTIVAAVHVKGAPGAVVRGIWFQPPPRAIGGAGVIVEDSPGAQVLHNRMTQLQFGILVQRADDAIISGNTISTPVEWDLDPASPDYLADVEGIMILGGRGVRVTDNHVSNALVGIFASDRPGEIAGNTVVGNAYGIQLCKQPDTLFRFSGSPQGSANPASGWSVRDNRAHDNLWGIVVIDGAHDNVLANNHASDNGLLDIELAGDTKRFAPVVPVAPASYDNWVFVGAHPNLVLKDCGRGNRVIGAVQRVDVSAVPCN